MPTRRLLLKDGVEPGRALQVLRDLVTESGNVTNSARPPNPAEMLRLAYMEWVERAEMQLGGLTHDLEIITMLQTPRYWQISTSLPVMPRPSPIVDAEIKVQQAALGGLIGDLVRRVDRAARAPGEIAVLDTNVLLEYQEPNKIPWTNLLGAELIRLILPVRVIEELDAKKYSGNERLSKRARALLPRLEQMVENDGSPREFAVGTTIEVLLADPPRFRPSDADEEILAVCLELQRLTGGRLTLVTADTGSRLRAAAQGTRTVGLPAAYRRSRDA
jgi:hypothetical protein